MAGSLKQWQNSVIRNGIMRYRENLQNYYIQNKSVVETASGTAFSLLSPPLGSPAARRRVRRIMDDMTVATNGGNSSPTMKWVGRTPHFVTIAVTYRCQCDCAHCSAYIYRRQVEQAHSQLSTAEMKSVIQDALALGSTCIILTGGEPLLMKNIRELIEVVPRSEGIVTIFTNGECLSKPLVRELKDAGLFGVFVSLDYPDAERHDTNRKRPGLFEKAVSGIRLCQEAGIVTGISTFATRQKIASGELDTMMEQARNLGVLELFVFDLIATGRLKDQKENMLGPSQVSALREFRNRYNLKSSYPRIIHQTMFTSMTHPCAAEGCPGGTAQMHLRGNGDVTPCDFTPLSFGNIRQRSLREIWFDMCTSDIYSKPSAGCRLADPAFQDRLMRSGAAVG